MKKRKPLTEEQLAAKKEYMRLWYLANKERRAAEYTENAKQILAGHAEYRRKNREKRCALHAKYRKENPEKVSAYFSAWYLENKDTVKIKNAAWAKANPHVTRAIAARRQAAVSIATPGWANKFFMSEIYDLARRRTSATNIPHCVDHIVPIKSDLVCGLHYESNMQVITVAKNRKKRNFYWPDMPE